MAGTIDSLFEFYAARYSEGDLQGIASLCVAPFSAVRKGQVIFMPDRGAVLSHFAASIDAYRRASGAQTWSPREISTRELGSYSAFATVHWNGTADRAEAKRALLAGVRDADVLRVPPGDLDPVVRPSRLHPERATGPTLAGEAVAHRDPHGIALRRHAELAAAADGLTPRHAPILRTCQARASAVARVSRVASRDVRWGAGNGCA